MVIAEFTVNNKTYLATKISLFMVNYSRELRIGANIRRREKIEKMMKFVEISQIRYLLVVILELNSVSEV